MAGGEGSCTGEKKLIMMVTVSGQKPTKTQERTKKQSERDGTETKETKLDPPAPKPSLVGAAASIIFVATKVLLRQNVYCDKQKTILSQQKFRRGKHASVVTKDAFCHDKRVFVATNTFCHDKNDTCGSSSRQRQ